MPRGGRLHSVRSFGSSRKATEWGDGPESVAIQSVTTAGATIVTQGLESLQHQTVVRVRGELAAWVTLATSVGDGFATMHAGIGIVSADAFAAGVGSMPNPRDDEDWPGWLWYHAGAAIVSLETTEIGRGPIASVRIPIDSKAMRKWRLNEIVFGSVQFGTEVGTAAVDFSMVTRLLAKVH